jgi:hypothetical protein
MRSNCEERRDIEQDDIFPPQAPLPIDPHRFWKRREGRSGARSPYVAAALVVATAILMPAVSQPVRSQAVQIVEVDVKAVAQGYRASKLNGSDVVNDKNEKIGDIDDIIIGSDKKLLFAILEVGGFLGIGAQLVAIPFEQLVLDPAGNKITLPGGSKEALKRLPVFKYAG